MTIDKNKIIDAIFDNDGFLELAAKQVGCSLRAIYNHRDRNPDVAEAITDARETFNCEILDIAESKLAECVKNGDFWAIKYVLSTKGKSRGYTDRHEIDHSGQVKQIVMQMDIADDAA